MRRKSWLFVAIAVIVLLAGDVIYWRLTANRLRDGVDAWLNYARANGWSISSAPVSLGGWPRSASVSLPDLKAAHSGPDAPGDATFASDRVTLSVPLWHPVVIDIALQGQQRVKLGDLQPVLANGKQIRITLPADEDGSNWADWQASELHLEPEGGGWQAQVSHASCHLEASEPENGVLHTITFNADAQGIDLPATVKWPLGPSIKSVSVEGTLNGPLSAMHNVTTWADTWRDGGGSLELKPLAVEWGPLNLVSSATLALDDQRQPMGSGNAKVAGYAETLDRLAANGVLTKSAAQVAKAMLSLLAGTGNGDSPPSVDVPLTLQYRTLSMRQVPLVRLPELDWPAR